MINEYILKSRYLNKNLNEKDYADVCNRVCKKVCPDDDFIKEQMILKKFCPGGRTLAYMGTEHPVSANCLVLPLGDSIPAIIDTLSRALLLQKHGMGIGFSFDNIHPFEYVPTKNHSYRIFLKLTHPDIWMFLTSPKYNIFEKTVIIPKNITDVTIPCQIVNYNKKFFMKYPEVLRVENKSIKELIAETVSRGIETVHDDDIPNGIIIIEDNMDSILNYLRGIPSCYENDILIDLSRLRCASSICDIDVKSGGPLAFGFMYDVVLNAILHQHKTTPISWLYVFSACSNIITQTNRNGANIAVLNADSKYVLDFIKLKNRLDVINNFNLSVSFTDEFMEAVSKGESIFRSLYEEVVYDESFLVKSVTKTGSLYTADIWEEFIKSAYSSGEPGCIFIDTVNKRYLELVPVLGKITACNPCGEIMMYPNEVCNLGAINLEEFVTSTHSNEKVLKLDEFYKEFCPADPREEQMRKYNEYLTDLLYKRFLRSFDAKSFRKTVSHAVSFLNSVIDLINVPDKAVIEKVRTMRRLGLGLMGFANMLLKIKIPYDSDASVKIIEFIMNIMRKKATKKSIKLAKRFGSIGSRLGLDSSSELAKQANIATLCCAPTGSIALMLGTSYSLEPEFKMCYQKTYAAGDKENDVVINKYFKEYLIEHDLYSLRNLYEISEYGLSNAILMNKNDELFMPNDIDIEVFKSAAEISPKNHLRVQATFQKFIDNSISKTINFNNNVPKDEMSHVIIQGWKDGVKGTTVYRDGCRNEQVLIGIDPNCKSGSCSL